MASKRTQIDRIFVQVLVVLLLSVIVMAQFPELLSLVDDTTNDFTVKTTNALDSLVLLHASRPVRIIYTESNCPEPGFPFSHVTLADNPLWVPSKLLMLNGVLRT
jgi:hypothetical protein